MDESIKNYLARLQTEKMELKSSLREIGFLMKLKPNKALTRELDRILDRLAYLEKVEKEIRKRI
ncbi:MAG TPA: hypothetical protein DEQ30_05030 [Porphyromonadaceae bacterium]|nr:hypothetical protein [Porphyromonadaceae bacterium]